MRRVTDEQIKEYLLEGHAHTATEIQRFRDTLLDLQDERAEKVVLAKALNALGDAALYAQSAPSRVKAIKKLDDALRSTDIISGPNAQGYTKIFRMGLLQRALSIVKESE